MTEKVLTNPTIMVENTVAINGKANCVFFSSFRSCDDGFWDEKRQHNMVIPLLLEKKDVERIEGCKSIDIDINIID